MQLSKQLFSYFMLFICTIHKLVYCHEQVQEIHETNEDQFIHPHAFKNNMDKSWLKKSTWDLSKNIENDCLQSEVFYKHLITLILSRSFIVKDEKRFSSTLHLSGSVDEMQSLESYLHGKVSMRKIDTILNKIIQKPQTDHVGEIIFLSDKIMNFICEHKNKGIAVICVVIGFFFVRKILWTRYTMVVITISIIFSISYLMTWYQLIQEAEVKQMAQQMKYSQLPITCQPHKMSWWDRFVHMFSDDNECEQHYKSLLLDPKWKVTPALVLTELFGTILMHPSSIFGHGLANFMDAATGKLGHVGKIIMTPIIFIGVIILIVSIIFALSKSGMSLKLGPLFSFTFGSHPDQHKSIHLEKRIEEIHKDIKSISSTGVIEESKTHQEFEVSSTKIEEVGENSKHLARYCEPSITLHINLNASGDASNLLINPKNIEENTDYESKETKPRERGDS